MVKYRNLSVDFLRGLAIFGMVLAAVIPWTAEFPGWMYHAQVGPPDFTFNPNNPGITWVDLVFPFFLFAMGAAFPFALKTKLANKEYLTIVQGLLRRGALLVFFAIALAYLTPGNLTAAPWVNYLTSLATFFSFFLVFMRFEGTAFKKYGLQLLGFIIIAAFTYYHSEIVGNTFSKSKNNIIILVLSNMAVFGSACWLFTASNFYLRIAIMVAFMGIWFTHSLEGSWTAAIWDFHPDIKWFYNFSFLKYLCIVLPGSILGDLVLKYKEVTNKLYEPNEVKSVGVVALACFAFVVFHVVTLYTRELTINLIGHFLFVALYLWYFRNKNEGQIWFYKVLLGWGLSFATVALFFEPLDGGIKKDPSSFSYWFLTSGLAFIFYVTCDYLTKVHPSNRVISALVKCGQNPMIAYCVTAFCITPVLGLIQVLPILDNLAAESPYLGLIRTVLFMFLMIWITNIATDKKWFWRS
jgi:predicted acyltransferase